MKPALAEVVLIGGSNNQERADKDRPVLISPGIYEAVMIDWKINYSGYFKKHSLLMHFRIVEMGESYGVVLPAWFNIQPSKGKSIKAGWRSDFLRMYQECFNTRLDRRDRIPMHRFENVALMVEVETISKDSKGHSLGNINQYSRVRRCLEVL